MTAAVPASRVLGLLAAANEHNGELTLAEASELLGVPVESVPGVVAELAVVGVPPFLTEDLLEIAVDGDWLVIEPHPALSQPLAVSPADGALLLACLRAFSAGTRGPLRELSGDVAARFRESLGAMSGEAEHRSDAIAWHVEATFDPAVLEQLRRAAEERLEVDLEYWSAGRDDLGWRRVQPWAIVQHEGRWYLGGWCSRTGSHRHFRLDRVLTVHVSDTTFVADEASAHLYRRHALYDPPEAEVRAEVWFPAGRAEEALRRLRGGEVLHEDGGRTLLGVCAPTAPLLIRRLFAMGGEWEVARPPEIRALVAQWCERAL